MAPSEGSRRGSSVKRPPRDCEQSRGTNSRCVGFRDQKEGKFCPLEVKGKEGVPGTQSHPGGLVAPMETVSARTWAGGRGGWDKPWHLLCCSWPNPIRRRGTKGLAHTLSRGRPAGRKNGVVGVVGAGEERGKWGAAGSRYPRAPRSSVHGPAIKEDPRYHPGCKHGWIREKRLLEICPGAERRFKC